MKFTIAMPRIALLIVISAVLTFAGCKSAGDSQNPSGSLEATEVDIVTTIPGRISTIHAELGDKVTAGDTLVVLDTELLQLQRAQTGANNETIRAQSQILAAQQQQAETNLRLAETSLERIRALLAQGSATQQQLDEAQAKRDVAAAQVTYVRNQMAGLGAERDKLRASLAVFDRQITEGVLLAPISGTVILRAVEPGEMASPGSTLLRIADLTSLDLRVFLNETDLGKVKVGQELPVIVDAFPDQSFTGKVIWISPEAEFTPKNVQTREARTQLVYAVKLSLTNADGRLHIGMPVEVKI